jgi:hypothetical protein
MTTDDIAGDSFRGRIVAKKEIGRSGLFGRLQIDAVDLYQVRYPPARRSLDKYLDAMASTGEEWQSEGDRRQQVQH